MVTHPWEFLPYSSSQAQNASHKVLSDSISSFLPSLHFQNLTSPTHTQHVRNPFPVSLHPRSVTCPSKVASQVVSYVRAFSTGGTPIPFVKNDSFFTHLCLNESTALKDSKHVLCVQPVPPRTLLTDISNPLLSPFPQGLSAAWESFLTQSLSQYFHYNWLRRRDVLSIIWGFARYLLGNPLAIFQFQNSLGFSS